MSQSALAPQTDLKTSQSSSRVSIHVPPNLLILPPTGALVGFLLGMSRGGSRARLRFLAENAHRQPKTVQGWYFYTKTRNYRVFFGGIRTGARYALGLGAATSLYVCIDEGVGWAREKVFYPEIQEMTKKVQTPTDNVVDGREDEGVIRALTKTNGWRKGPVHWEDGAVAGALLGGVVGFVYRLPNPLVVRSLIVGVVMGTLTSVLQIAQDYVATLRDASTSSSSSSPSTPLTESESSETILIKSSPSSSTLSSSPTSSTITSKDQHLIVDRPLQPSESIEDVKAPPRPSIWQRTTGWFSRS